MPDNKSIDVENIPDFEKLERYPRKRLLTWFERLYRNPPPLHSSRQFLALNIAWGVQAVNIGEQPLALRKALKEKLTEAFGKTTTHPHYKVGTRLVREWHGVVHEVLILESAYLWQGKTYNSLSSIAREITGAQWSGPRFFGLRASTPTSSRNRQKMEKQMPSCGGAE